MRARINLNAIQAAALASSIEETRYYLKGVCVEISARQSIYCATNGHILFAYRDELQGEHEAPRMPGGPKVMVAGEPDNSLIGSWIIPTEALKRIKVKPSRHNADWQFAEIEGEAGKPGLTIKYEGINYGFDAISGTFPDWRRVVTPSSEALSPKFAKECDETMFDPALLSALWKAGEKIDRPKPVLVPNGKSPALVHYRDENAIGIIMPMATNSTLRNARRPAWIDPATEAAPEAQKKAA